jgi:hypothetical protein
MELVGANRKADHDGYHGGAYSSSGARNVARGGGSRSFGRTELSPESAVFIFFPAVVPR